MSEKKKVLIVDDEKPLANALQYKLKEANFNTEVAYDGEEALQKIKSEKPDIILLDLVMPKLDGFGVLEKLKADNNLTPIIVLSNLGQEPDVKIAKELGAKDFCIKSDTQLSRVVEKVQEFI